MKVVNEEWIPLCNVQMYPNWRLQIGYNSAPYFPGCRHNLTNGYIVAGSYISEAYIYNSKCSSSEGKGYCHKLTRTTTCSSETCEQEI